MIYFAAVSLISSVISAPQTCVVLKPCFLLVLTVYCMPLFCFVDIVDNSGIFIALVSFELTTFNSLKELEEVCCQLILPQVRSPELYYVHLQTKGRKNPYYVCPNVLC